MAVVPFTRRLQRQHTHRRDDSREDDVLLHAQIEARKAALDGDQQAVAQLCDR
jgi:hypothetical protein